MKCKFYLVNSNAENIKIMDRGFNMNIIINMNLYQTFQSYYGVHDILITDKDIFINFVDHTTKLLKTIDVESIEIDRTNIEL